ncbi:Cytosol aminopeptidase [Nosema granulosis]|uniref:leucyl aminopeptidase n=1 Tax=Nosema granulosis TaxID=83296 RepID=A0A9P6KZ95_9MICR|nr:Cytosol aminopeptidase [Nosema granulosis]
MKFDYKKLFVFETQQPGKDVVPVAYSKDKDSFKIYNKGLDPGHANYLANIEASNSTGEVFVRFEKDKIFVYVCFGELKGDLEKLKDGISMAGAKCLKAVAYLNTHINFYVDFEEYDRDFIGGLILSSYKYDFNKKESKNKLTLSIIGNENVKKYISIYNSQNFARFLGDTPANLMTPTLFAEYACDLLKDLKVEVFDKKFMEENKMNLLLSVAQGSEQEPRLLSISYKGRESDEVDIGLVGKGITFDSGGISIKPSANMAAMKGDMLGGASVVSVMKLVSDFKLKANVRAVIPLTENLPSGSATKPGDVFCGMSGKSVEVDNTDAEGRLVLADALTYIQQSKPKYVMDIATLTGAMAISLGDSFIGFFCNDDKLAEVIYQSGIQSSDPAWRLPLSSLYLSSMKSTVADLKNVGGRFGGSAIAAIFLNEFIEKDTKWAHFDIAGVMDSSRNTAVYGKYMTGKGVPVVFETVQTLIQHLSN